MMDLFAFAVANMRAEFGAPAPEPKPARLVPSAGHGYAVRYSRTNGHAHALDCAFCLFTVYPGDCAGNHPGQRYGRAKAQMIAHVLGRHADEFSAANATANQIA